MNNTTNKLMARMSFGLLSSCAICYACSSIAEPEKILTRGTLAQHVKKDSGDNDRDSSIGAPILGIEISDATALISEDADLIVEDKDADADVIDASQDVIQEKDD